MSKYEYYPMMVVVPERRLQEERAVSEYDLKKSEQSCKEINQFL
jgi:hypothetical protein